MQNCFTIMLLSCLFSFIVISKAFASTTDDIEEIAKVLQASIDAIDKLDIEALSVMTSKKSDMIIDHRTISFYKQKLGGQGIKSVWADFAITFASENYRLADMLIPIVCVQPSVSQQLKNIYLILTRNKKSKWQFFSVL